MAVNVVHVGGVEPLGVAWFLVLRSKCRRGRSFQMERGSAFPEPLQQQHPETKHSLRTTLRDLTVEGSGSQLQNCYQRPRQS